MNLPPKNRNLKSVAEPENPSKVKPKSEVKLPPFPSIACLRPTSLADVDGSRSS